MSVGSQAQASVILTNSWSFSSATGDSSSEVILDSAGNRYGTTSTGGLDGGGIIYEIAAGSQSITTLVNFPASTGPNGPSFQASGLILDVAGNIYGTTYNSGANNKGAIFKVNATTHALTILASFNGTNGANPGADGNGLIFDHAGNLYGDTFAGGTNNDGTVFELPSGSNTIASLASFNGTNGRGPAGGRLVMDAFGNLYGTTYYGGNSDDGTVFQIAAATHAINTLVTFNGTNGSLPESEVISDHSGTLYGTTKNGGANGAGTVFEVAANTNALTTLSFDGTNGGSPQAGLVEDAAGNLFGTSVPNGLHSTVFEVPASTGKISTIYTFNTAANGTQPFSSLTPDSSGNLYGVTIAGGANRLGTVYELTGTGFAVPEPGAIPVIILCSAVLLVGRPQRRAA
jgi:uncharacterized repeat protein (TIGR03803 family)